MKEKKDASALKFTLNIIGGEILYGIIFFIIFTILSYLFSGLIAKNTILSSIISTIFSVLASIVIFKFAVKDSLKRYNIKKEDISKVIILLIIIHIIFCIISLISSFSDINESLLKIDDLANKFSFSEEKINEYVNTYLNFSSYESFKQFLYIDTISSAIISLITYLLCIILYTKNKLIEEYK